MRTVLLALAVVTAYAADTPCRDQMTCVECINHHTFCGWCSPKTTVYNNGTVGSRCQDQRENNWHCKGVYSTDKCKQGYICNGTAGTCMKAGKGQGDTLEHCNATCHKSPPAPPAPHTLKVCNVTAKKCMECQDYCNKTNPCPGASYCVNGLCHGSKCQQAPACNATCSADTPDVIVGVWRGIMIHAGYEQGEWNFEFRKRGNDAPQVTICPPIGACSTGGLEVDTASQGTDLRVTYDKGPYKGATYVGGYHAWEPSPVTETVTFFFGLPNTNTHPSITDAMSGQGFTVFEMSRCSHHFPRCNFTSAMPHSPHRALEVAPPPPIHDPCQVYKDCTHCTHAPSNLCGWCSQPVQYMNKSTGAQCAGFDKTGKPLGWVCHGTFYKGDCNDYGCDFSDIEHPKCKVCNDSSCTLTKKECNSTCKAPPKTYRCDNSTGTPECKTCNVSYCRTSKDCPGSYCHIHGPGPWTCHGGQGPCPVKNKTHCNSTCTPPKPANSTKVKCDHWGGQCVKHPNGTTPYLCSHACKDLAPSGTWRGIAVNKGFKRGEWDFTFYINNSLHWRTAEGKTYQAKVYGFNATQNVDKTMQITGEVVSTKEKFFGIYKVDDQGDDKLIDMLFWGQGSSAISSFDDAFDATLVLLNKCRKGMSECDFSPSIVTLDAEYHTAIAYATEYDPIYDEM